MYERFVIGQIVERVGRWQVTTKDAFITPRRQGQDVQDGACLVWPSKQMCLGCASEMCIMCTRVVDLHAAISLPVAGSQVGSPSSVSLFGFHGPHKFWEVLWMLSKWGLPFVSRLRRGLFQFYSASLTISTWFHGERTNIVQVTSWQKVKRIAREDVSIWTCEVWCHFNS